MGPGARCIKKKSIVSKWMNECGGQTWRKFTTQSLFGIILLVVFLDLSAQTRCMRFPRLKPWWGCRRPCRTPRLSGRISGRNNCDSRYHRPGHRSGWWSPGNDDTRHSWNNDDAKSRTTNKESLSLNFLCLFFIGKLKT